MDTAHTSLSSTVGRLLAFRRDPPPQVEVGRRPPGGGLGLGERVSRGLVQSGRDAVANLALKSTDEK